jgi:hypothetical protein
MAITILSNHNPLIYGFDDTTNAPEVSKLIESIRSDLGIERMNKTMIYVLSGTHGDQNGDLKGEKLFFIQDKSKELQTVKCVNVNEKTPDNTWNAYFSKINSILILGWCWSEKWKGLKTRLPSKNITKKEAVRRKDLLETTR